MKTTIASIESDLLLPTALDVLALIPARGGSKGVPRKNIRPLCGKSLVQRAHEVANASKCINRVILSTDDPQIAEHGKAIGLEVPFLRPASFATDHSPMIDVVLHAVEYLRAHEGYAPDAVLLLQPTAPLRTPQHIQRSIELLSHYDSVCSVCPVPRELCPHFLMKIDRDGCLKFFMPDGAAHTRRQDVPLAYRRDGSIYLTRLSVVLQKQNLYGARCNPMVLSHDEVLNIDSLDDWATAELRLSHESSPR
jgi:CMP-N,N'-diacetyllegionaminic acid synthase